MKVESNSPLQSPPHDYCPAGSEHWFRIPEGYDAGKTMFYSDYKIGEGTPDFTVMFVHGNPECSYTYRHIRDGLIASGKSMRLIAMDHIGLGLSDQADFEMVDMHHTANLKQLIQHLDLNNVTLVVHDWGGPIGIGAFLDSPELVSALLVMNTTVFPMPNDGYTYTNYPFPWVPWYLTAPLIPDALWGGVAAAVVSHASPQGTVKFLSTTAKYLALHALRAIPEDAPEYVWSQMLRGKANARSSKRNVRQTPVWGYGYRYRDRKHGIQDNHTYHANIQARLSPLWGPDGQNIAVSGFFGQWDACGKDSVINQWQNALPQMQDACYRHPDIGHFIEEYKGPEMASAILSMNDKL